MDRGPAVAGAGQPVGHVAGVDADMRQAVPVQFAIRPGKRDAGGAPMVHASPVGVEEDHVAGLSGSLLRERNARGGKGKRGGGDKKVTLHDFLSLERRGGVPQPCGQMGGICNG